MKVIDAPIPERAKNALLAYDITTLEAVAICSDPDLLEIPDISYCYLHRLRLWIAEEGA